jgi:hypothetical protein
MPSTPMHPRLSCWSGSQDVRDTQKQAGWSRLRAESPTIGERLVSSDVPSNAWSINTHFVLMPGRGSCRRTGLLTHGGRLSVPKSRPQAVAVVVT